MKIEKVKIGDIKPNASNPRIIKDDKFKKLVDSIQNFPQMLEIRPIVVDETMTVLGGNMRLRACKDAGLKEVFIIRANDLSEEQKTEFIVKDNVGFGEWDWDALANEFNSEQLNDWGLDVPIINDVDLDGFFTENNDEDIDHDYKIVLTFTADEYEQVLDAFSKHPGTKENVIFNLLGCKQL